MPQELYNEGRVVGFSAWEIFARDAIAHGISPEDIPDEHEWLTEMVCKGTSMILRVDANTPKGYVDYPLPSDSKLTAAGVIIGSLFIGECDIACDQPDGDPTCNFATKVTSYGPLISNLSGSGKHPGSSPDNIPAILVDGYPDYSGYVDEITEFVKINDGIVYTKTAQWIPTSDGSPYDDINPDFPNSRCVVRLYLSETINTSIYILLTGFEHKAFLDVISGWATSNGGVAAGGSTDITANNWANGGMIGPETIPWASKIIFTVPSAAYSLSTNITRTLPKGAENFGDGDPITIDSKVHISNYIEYKPNVSPFIDFDSINLLDYYFNIKHFSSDPTITEEISAVNLGFVGSYNALVAWYPGMSATAVETAVDDDDVSNFFPPALYATKVSSSGDQTMVPIDVAAPGTVKCFNTAQEAINYRTLLPNNFAVYHDTTNNTYSFVDGNNMNNWSSSAKIEYLTEPIAKVTTTSTSTKFVALNSSSNVDYDLNGGSGSISTKAPRALKWNDMLTALKDSKTLNILGDRLTTFATELATGEQGTIGTTASNKITEIGATKLTIEPGANGVSFTSTTAYSTKLATLGSGTSIKSGTNFIEFSNGLRLYILAPGSTPPTSNVPVNSIGIGW